MVLDAKTVGNALDYVDSRGLQMDTVVHLMVAHRIPVECSLQSKLVRIFFQEVKGKEQKVLSSPGSPGCASSTRCNGLRLEYEFKSSKYPQNVQENKHSPLQFLFCYTYNIVHHTDSMAVASVHRHRLRYK